MSRHQPDPNKFPRAAALAAKRRRDDQENPSLAVARSIAVQADMRWREAERKLAMAEKFLSSKISEHVRQEMGQSFIRALDREVMNAISHHYESENQSKTIEIRLPAELVRFQDPKSLQRIVFEQYLRNLDGKDEPISAKFVEDFTGASQSHQVSVRVHVPSFNRAFAISEGALR